jgi:hypothetical protein
MNWNDRRATVGVAKETMAAFNTNDIEASFLPSTPQLAPCHLGWATASRGDRHSLYADEIQWLYLIAIYFDAKFNRLSHPLHQLIQRPRLRMTTW